METGLVVGSALPWAALGRAGTASLVACGMSAGAGAAAKGSCAAGCPEVLAWHVGASSSAKAFSANAATASAPKSCGKLHSLF